MSEKGNIEEIYNKRAGKEALYNSVYSKLADEERIQKCKALLKEHFGEAGDKRILEIGAGHGGNVPMLLDYGFKMDNIHLNELLQERALSISENYPSCKLFKGDVLEIDLKERYDCVFQSTVFTSILDQSKRKEVADKMWSLLKPGGMILWYDFVFNNPNNKDVRKVSVKEIKALFPMASAFHVVSVTLAPPIGRKLGKWYHLFNWPILRTHVLMAITKV